ncbi:hypothetical protein Tc00.1047053510773.30 [Trypanosoma cruzi]|uniref:Uncharacterized protein n=1 Tax=Trypanosoma cruzi (strain CL Brener) TaxID=353153 RepID=Q4DGG4_TRYCC|nr:hypothetical protein Tc00.1047053510773.30 [Trypanosoma cruzi]EAN91610.1 hypothetical protein Tc00.1047053510773.30 [Trypanosoma cruzi]|eukprot:XP_813461.1 hypothetical protein [Trypanosoma cruzi strain CL Brener]
MPLGGSAHSFTSGMEWLQTRTAKGEVAPSDTAAHSRRVLRPLNLSELQRGSRHAVSSAGKQTTGVLSGADGRGRHQLSRQENTTADVAARQGRLPAMFRGPAKGCATYSPLGDAVVCSAWGKKCFAAGTWEEAILFTPRLPEKKSSLTTKHLPWGKFTIRRSRHPSPKERAALAQSLAYTAPDTTCAVTVADTAASPDSTVSPASPASPDSSSGVLLSQLGLRAFSKRAELRSCQAVFERTSKVLLREKGYRERILKIVEEVCDAVRAAAAVNVADTDEGDGVQMMGDFPAASTVSLPTGGVFGPPTVVTEEAPSKSRSISRLHKMGHSCNQFLGVDSASAMPPLSLQKDPVSTSQEQQKFPGASGERIPNAATQETVLPRLRESTNKPLGVEAVRDVDSTPDDAAAAKENKETQSNEM